MDRRSFTRCLHRTNTAVTRLRHSHLRDTARSCEVPGASPSAWSSPPRAVDTTGAGRVRSLGEQCGPRAQPQRAGTTSRHRRSQRTPMRFVDRRHSSSTRLRSSSHRSTSGMDARRLTLLDPAGTLRNSHGPGRGCFVVLGFGPDAMSPGSNTGGRLSGADERSGWSKTPVIEHTKWSQSRNIARTRSK